MKNLRAIHDCYGMMNCIVVRSKFRIYESELVIIILFNIRIVFLFHFLVITQVQF